MTIFHQILIETKYYKFLCKSMSFCSQFYDKLSPETEIANFFNKVQLHKNQSNQRILKEGMEFWEM